jgi:hypothetical protein
MWRSKKFAEQSGGVFAEFAVVGSKSSKEMGVDVRVHCHFAVNEDESSSFFVY